MLRRTTARKTLKLAETTINDWIEEMRQGPAGTMPLPWFDWLELLYLYREAKILITATAPKDDPRLDSLQQAP